MQGNQSIINIAAYKFITLNDFTLKKQEFKDLCNILKIKGTILLSSEGINFFLAGSRNSINTFVLKLRQDNRFFDIKIKVSISKSQPFRRMLVRLKKEIITMKNPTIRPENTRAPSINSIKLKSWIEKGSDDQGKKIILIDTRNAFEVSLGTFKNALNLNIKKFSDFPNKIKSYKNFLKNKTLITFCTGGIRCEKAALYMKNIGYLNVFQLDGGILKYFEEVGGLYFEGNCFVFDHRTALNFKLEETSLSQCYACRSILTEEDQKSAFFLKGNFCHNCYKSKKNILIKEESF
tara:strand:+ start:134 stop:1009 length:876 start_codon:yes stop_codon:yes gene_type:complete